MKRVFSLILTLALILTFIPGNVSFAYATTNDLNISLSAEEFILIQFDSNGGTGISQIEALSDQVITLPSEVPTKSGYSFVGWATSKNGDAEYRQNDFFYTDESTTLYAQWDKLCDPYAYEDCDYCHGAGEIYSHSLNCSDCDGSGKSSISCTLCDGTGKRDCYWCDGTGSNKNKEKTCTTCGGSGNESCSVGVCNTCSSVMGMTVRDYDGSCQRAGHSVWVTCTRCSKCGGDGKIADACSWCDGIGKKDCSSCDGAGKRDCSSCDGIGIKRVYKDCGKCAGKGKIQAICSLCDGTGMVIRKSVSAPDAPTLNNVNETTVVLNAVQNAEYSVDGINWQDSPVFNGLDEGQLYSCYQRYAKTDTTNTSESSEPLIVLVHNHAYDNDCDTVCNDCGWVRTPLHFYDDGSDAVCNLCGHNRAKSSGTTGGCSWHVMDTTLYINGNGEMAFYDTTGPWGCSITRVVVNEGVIGIGNKAFYECKELTSVAISKSVTYVGYDAFRDCDKLKDVWYSGSSQSSIIFFSDDAPLTNATWHYNVDIVGEHIYDSVCAVCCNICGDMRTVPHVFDNACDTTCNVCGVTRAAWHMFDNACDATCNVCGSTRTVIGHEYDNVCDTTCNECEHIRTVPDHVYDNLCDKVCNECGTTRMPPHVYDIDCDAVCNDCGETRTVSHLYDSESDAVCKLCGHKRVTSSGTTGDCNWYVLDTTLYITGYGDMAPYSDTGPWGRSITKVVVNEGVTSIGNKAFYNCDKLTSVTIPDSVTSIGEKAFAYCDGITTVAIGEGVTSIGDNAFCYCKKLATIAISKRLKSVGSTAFYRCSELKDVWYSGSSQSDILISYNNTPLTNANWHNNVDIAGEHVYDSACSVCCNICGDTRTAPHVYDNEKDHECNECGYVADIYGDMNGDSKVNISDAVTLYYAVNGKTNLKDESKGDLNGDGKVNISDAVTLYYFVNGKIEKL